MSTPVEAVQAQASLQEAASKMKDADVGMLPVMNGDRCVGVVTDRDIVIRALSEGNSQKRIDEVMTPNPVCLNQETDVEEAMRTMEQQHIGRVVVTDGGERPIGVVSAGAIAIRMRGNPRVGHLASDLSAAHSHGSQ
jgi:CBS domain-containing protein